MNTIRDLKFNWIRDERSDTSVFGIQSHGGGVYWDSKDGTYYGNSVVNGELVMLEKKENVVDAMMAVEANFISRTQDI